MSFLFKTKNGKSIFEPLEEIKSSKNKIDLSNEKKELIISAIKEGKIESDLNVISFIKKKNVYIFIIKIVLIIVKYILLILIKIIIVIFVNFP